MRIFWASAALVLALPVFATAQGKPSERKDPEAVSCKVVRELGSRIPVRICKTNAEWESEEAAAREAMKFRNRNSACAEGPC